MDIFFYLAAFFVLIIFFGYQSIIYKKNTREKLLFKLNKQWGSSPNKDYSATAFLRIRKYFDIVKNDKFVDEITWNDLGMDNIFKSLNYTQSSIGEDCLYNRLRSMDYSEEDLLEFDRLVSYFQENKDVCIKFQEIFANIGQTKSISVYEVIHLLGDLDNRKNTKHFALAAMLIAAIGSIFISPPFGIIATITMVVINVLQYYKSKSKIENYFICCGYLVGLIVNAKKIADVSDSQLSQYNMEIEEIYKKISIITKNIFLMGTNNMSGSLADMVMEYVRMLFHVDLIKFNSVKRKATENIKEIDRLYSLVGYIESACSVAYYRQYLKEKYSVWCKPDLTQEKLGIVADDIYHPLLDNPVSNTIKEERGVLLTGSNASGKSTFLKTIGINCVLAQTIYTSSAKCFRINRCLVYSSMSLKDDLTNNESYYMVEIKALKRIIDAAKSGEKIICFVDEVLRGTNTVERVSASTEILKSFADSQMNNVLCFAATHDIELTYLLDSYYANYHFEEEIKNDDVLFNYILNVGPATSRNAIQLLKVMGYDDKIVSMAKDRADKFMETGQY